MSPLYQKSKQDLIRDETEIMIVLSGTDDTLSQSVSARFSYVASDIVWNHRFADILSRAPDGHIRVDLRNFHEVHKIE